MANEKIDLISRAALIEAVEKQRIHITNYTTAESIVRAQGRLFRKAVDEAPTVDAVEVVHAVWGDGGAVDRNGNIVYKSIDCSNCFEYFKIESHDREYWKARFKVCPFCGAKMDGGKT